MEITEIRKQEKKQRQKEKIDTRGIAGRIINIPILLNEVTLAFQVHVTEYFMSGVKARIDDNEINII